MKKLNVYVGAGISAELTWPEVGRVEIRFLNPEGMQLRGVRGPWTRPAINRCDSQVRHACFLAVRSGQAPALDGGFVHISMASGAIRAEK